MPSGVVDAEVLACHDFEGVLDAVVDDQAGVTQCGDEGLDDEGFAVLA